MVTEKLDALEKLDVVKSFIDTMFNTAQIEGYQLQIVAQREDYQPKIVGKETCTTADELFERIKDLDLFEKSTESYRVEAVLPGNPQPINIGELELETGIFWQTQIVYDGLRLRNPRGCEVLRYGVQVEHELGTPPQIRIVEGSPRFIGSCPVSNGDGASGRDTVSYFNQDVEQQLKSIIETLEAVL